MSKPPTHNPIASPSSHGSAPPRPPAAIQPPTGATAMASPRNSCVYAVYRFASEYQKMIARATGLSARHTTFSRDAAYTNTTDDTATNATASRRVIVPRGSSRMRGGAQQADGAAP